MIYVQRKRIQEVADLYGYTKDYMANQIIDLMDADIVLPESKRRAMPYRCWKTAKM